MNNTSFYTEEELKNLGLKYYGKNVKLSRNCSIYNPQTISIGDNTRIDDFVVLSGKITIGSYVHISCFCGFWGGAGITLEDFTGVSGGGLLYSCSDNFSGDFMTNPCIPDKYRGVHSAPIILRKHSIIGARSIVLPGVELQEGTSVGAMSLITKTTKPWSIYTGIPARYLKARSKKILELEQKFLKELR